MTNSEKVLTFLRRIAPRQASNGEIVARTGVRPHQQVFQITQRLARAGRIRALKAGGEWMFWVDRGQAAMPVTEQDSATATRSSGDVSRSTAVRPSSTDEVPHDNARTNSERVIAFLESIAPERASNAEIAARTGVCPHQQVFQITQRLARAGRMAAFRSGREWLFGVEDSPPVPSAENAEPRSQAAGVVAPRPPRKGTAHASVLAELVATCRRPLAVAIQCAGSKRPDAGHFRDDRGRRLQFVAHPEHAPASPDLRFVHPDGPSDEGRSTWRERLVAYNEKRGDNPYSLLPSYRLYSHPVYAELAEVFGLENLFVLSGGWGLVRADFLLPSYDVSFAAGAPRWSRRAPRDPFRDFRHLPRHGLGTVVFLGGMSYRAVFEKLAGETDADRIVVHHSTGLGARSGFRYVQYKSAAKTNWHYLCARELATLVRAQRD